MKRPEQILIRPILTEKTSKLLAVNKYTFEVALDANKIEIRNLIEKLYNVKVDKVNTLVMKPKGKTLRLKNKPARPGFTKKWKKAIVSLQDGEKIELFKTES